jgi:Tfp pilus assembly protein PilV
MINTNFHRHSRAHNEKPRRSHADRLAAETGDTLIEVIISAVLIALVVIATTTGLNSTNRATALDRARSEADALAQQAEEELRSEPVAKLSELHRIQVVEEGNTKGGKTKYTITSTSTYIADASATSSCSSSTPHADYLQTTSAVTWPSMGVTKPVSESSIISPPPGSALIVQVTEDGNALEGALVSATGPTPAATAHTLETSSDGCAILALTPGNYELNVSKAGYVDPNWYPNTHEDLSTTRSAYLSPFLVAETTTKEAYDLGRAGTLEVGFLSGSTPAEGDSFVAFNSFMSAFKQIGTIGAYKPTIASEKIVYPYPESSPYTVYAGSCEADSPGKFGVEPATVVVPPGATGAVSVPLPPVNIRVMSGTSAGEPGTLVENARASTTDEGCDVKRSFTTTSSGALPRPGLPFGKYAMCVSSAGKKWEGKFENNTTAGPSATWTNGGDVEGNAVIYLGASPGGSPSGTEAGSCP